MLGHELLAQLVDAALDGIVVCDEEMRYVYANPRACEIMGRPLEDLAGRDFLMTFPERMHPAMRSAYAAQLAGRTGMWTGTLLRPDGAEVDIHWSNMTFTVDGRRYGAAIFRDVGSMGATARAAASLAAAAAATSAATGSGGDLEELLDSLAAWGKENTRALVVALDVVDENIVVDRGGRAGAPPGYAEAQRAVSEAGARIPYFSLWRTGRPVVLAEARTLLRQDPLWTPVCDCLDVLDWQAAVYLRIGIPGESFGGLSAFFPADALVPTEEEITYLRALADHAAIAVSQSRLLAARSQVAVLEERARLARELHDSVSQALFASALHARSAQKQAQRLGADLPARLGADLAALRELTASALADMRALIFELRPEALAAEGLVAALTKQGAAIEARTGLQVRVTGPSSRLTLTPAAEEHLYRAALEAVTNAVKYASAGSVCVQVQELGGCVEVCVTDDGVGFVPASGTGTGTGMGMGMGTMRSRMSALGGSLDVRSTTGAGTTVRLAVPL